LITNSGNPCETGAFSEGNFHPKGKAPKLFPRSLHSLRNPVGAAVVMLCSPSTKPFEFKGKLLSP
jgi:hypothetical protein